jgi:hypothetical protein
MTSSSFIWTCLLLSLSLLGPSACKPADGGADDGDQPATPIEADVFADVLAQQICEQVFACTCDYALGNYADISECVAFQTGVIAQRIDEELAPGGSWDPECAGQMVEALSDWECLGPNMAARTSTFSTLTCPILKSVVGAGGDCWTNPLGDDCEAGLLCVSGTCVTTPTLPVPDGQSCNYGDLPCESGSYCDWVPPNYDVRVCQPLPQAGDACDVDQYFCGPQSNDLVCEAGSCTTSPGEGESCMEWNLCAPGLYCDGGQDFTCQPRRELGEGCGADAVCPVDALCVNNICEPAPAAICNATGLFGY